MIVLKKNDKLIILIGIVVLIVAVIGIALYTQPSTEETTNNIVETESYYDVNWIVKTGSLSPISDYAGKKTPYEGTVSINQENLKSITFNLSWIDDKALLGRIGRDTLTLEVTTPDGTVYTESAQSAIKTKAGNATLTVSVGIAPSVTSIDGTDIYDAKQKLKDDYYSDKWSNKDFDIKVSVKVGEFLRKFFIFGDKGNTFNLDVNYEYYDALLTENSQMKETSQNQNTYLFGGGEEQSTPLGDLVNTGWTRW